MLIPVFMYHAVFNSPQALMGADHHYGVKTSEYLKQIEKSKSLGMKIGSIQQWLSGQKVDCIFTFDDGHGSNFDAASMLSEEGFSGDFFVNSSTINTQFFLTGSQLHEMANMGMSIQSHGHNHVFMSDLSQKELVEELRRSKSEIEDYTGVPVTIFAPPGGRINQRVVDCAYEAGYESIANSQPGYLSPSTKKSHIPRVAVYDAMTLAKYTEYLECRPNVMVKDKSKHFVTSSLKKILGNRSYDKLWQLLRGSK